MCKFSIIMREGLTNVLESRRPLSAEQMPCRRDTAAGNMEKKGYEVREASFYSVRTSGTARRGILTHL